MRRMHAGNKIASATVAALLLPGGALAAGIDFSSVGARIVGVPEVISVRPTGGDDTALLQGAIDHVAASGKPGAIRLMGERFRVSGSLHIRTSGIVLRGPATIVATGTSRRTLIEIGGTADLLTAAPVAIADDVVPAGATSFHVSGLKAGDRVVITRPSTKEWIAAIGMTGNKGNYANQRLDWAPGSRNLVWDRVVTSVDASGLVTIDAPITTALEKRYGGGTVARVTSGAPVSQIGIEFLTLESGVVEGKPKNEDHSWIAVSMDRVEDAWVMESTMVHFAGSAVRVGPRARRVTVAACHSEQPISEIGGYRRLSFWVEGQQVLVTHTTSEQGMNDFAIGLLAAGPNVFSYCGAKDALGPSGSFESWASGVVYDHVNVQPTGIRITNDGSRAEGAGWTAANSLVRDSQEPVEVKGPAGAENVVEHVTDATRVWVGNLRLLPPGPEFHAPTSKTRIVATHSAQVVNGRLVVDGKTIWGGMVNEGWWRGQEVPASALEVGGVSVTRFVPGRVGPGLTEDLPALAAKMDADGTPFYQSIPGLWYDRRRDEHSTNDRQDGNVWAPFYEMPWARSGEGRASDGLSKFDLSKFNPWYYERLAEWARLCDEHGFVFFHNIYNTHNLLEIPPHWVDYPWRPANNVNDTGLPEPPPIEPGSHIHVANEVYDISNPVRRELHRAMIVHELDELGSARNVLFSLGAQFAGPLAFQEFFQDTVADWEKRTGRTVRIELATSKDITDAILANPARAKQVAAIDMRYWQYRPDGSLFAPEGGKNLAFREMITAAFSRGAGDQPPDTTPYQVYRQVREYHDRYPKIALIAWHGGAGPVPVLMGGGAEALMRNPSAGQGQGTTVDRTPLDAFVKERLAGDLMKMEPRDGVLAGPEQNWLLADSGMSVMLVYSVSGTSVRFERALSGSYAGVWFDAKSGKTVEAVAGAEMEKPSGEAWLLLLKRK